MGIMTGYLCLLIFALLMMKAPARRLHLTKADRALSKIHKPLCAVLALSCMLHTISVLPLLHMRSRPVLATGISAVICLSLIIIFYRKRSHHRRWRRWHGMLAGLMLLCVAGHIAAYLVDFQHYQTRINQIRLHGIDIGSMADGQYIGEYDAGYLYAKVRVTVSDGAIQSITLLEHRNERGKAAEAVVSDIVERRAFPVDAVSGATNSSMVIQQAVQHALEGAKEE